MMALSSGDFVLIYVFSLELPTHIPTKSVAVVGMPSSGDSGREHANVISFHRHIPRFRKLS
jgi:hypothetical protein